VKRLEGLEAFFNLNRMLFDDVDADIGVKHKLH
jgi:hypothetical protein